MTPLGTSISNTQLILDRLGTVQMMQVIGLAITLFTIIFAFAIMASCLKVLGIALSLERLIKAWRSGKDTKPDTDTNKKPLSRREWQNEIIKEWERQGGKLK